MVVKVLFSGPSPHFAAFWALPGIGFALRIYVDGLTVTFLLLTVIIAVPACSIPSFICHYQEYGVVRYYPYFLLFLAAAGPRHIPRESR